MSVLVSYRQSESSQKFSKELFTEVSNNLAVFTDEEWESHKDEYKKVLIAVYVRTCYDNLVLMIDEDKFANIFNIPPFISDSGIYPTVLIDSGVVNAKEFITSAFAFKSAEALNRFVSQSTCYPVGAIETPKKFVLVFNTIISDEVLRDPDIVLNKGYYFRPIESLCLSDSLQREISESLVIVKKSEDKK